MRLDVAVDSYVSVGIHNLKGQLVEQLIDGNLSADTYELTWNASNQPSGVYFIQFGYNGNLETKKITLLK